MAPSSQGLENGPITSRDWFSLKLKVRYGREGAGRGGGESREEGNRMREGEREEGWGRSAQRLV